MDDPRDNEDPSRSTEIENDEEQLLEMIELNRIVQKILNTQLADFKNVSTNNDVDETAILGHITNIMNEINTRKEETLDVINNFKEFQEEFNSSLESLKATFGNYAHMCDQTNQNLVPQIVDKDWRTIEEKLKSRLNLLNNMSFRLNMKKSTYQEIKEKRDLQIELENEKVQGELLKERLNNLQRATHEEPPLKRSRLN